MSATTTSPYDIHLDDKYGHSKFIDVAAEAAAHEPWFNQTLTTVNDSLVRLGIFKGEFHWHKHDDQDEFFLVLEGQLLLDIAGAATVTLAPPPGLHRTQGGGASHPRPRPSGGADDRIGGRGTHWRLSS